MKKTILLIPLAMAVAINIRAQSVGPTTVNAAGGSVVIGVSDCEWSVGEMAIVNTFSTPGIIVTQGVLQPATPLPSGVANTTVPNGQLQVFPNPATSEVNLKYSSPSNGMLNYRLLDMAGKVIADHAIKIAPGTTSEKINVSDLACATYMLEVVVDPANGTSEKTSYKIQKLK